MNKFNHFLLPLFAILALASCSDDNGSKKSAEANVNANQYIGVSTVGNPMMPPEVSRLEFPKVKGGSSMIIVHKALLNKRTGERGVNYSTEWDTSKKSLRWSCYQMYRGNSEAHTSRYRSDTNQYPRDENIPSAFQFDRDPFWRTGYDHGHICPSADRLGSREANIQTFYLSNMMPQVHAFNDGVWKNMEAQIRSWNQDSFRDTLYVCKGGTIDNGSQILTTLGQGLIVPKYFFMAVLCKNKMGYKALGFWVEHEANGDTSLGKYVVNIQELEQKTGIDFFCNLPDAIEHRVETLPVEKVQRAWGLP
ncbi:DNA/RNA non-specific endonuclease [Hoylesella buccalis]|uniref:DNA/RNA non-specific endonuclease n=1 Tax=Hoylesella buccalis TaxID=28127 RepID=UPI003994E12A